MIIRCSTMLCIGYAKKKLEDTSLIRPPDISAIHFQQWQHAWLAPCRPPRSNSVPVCDRCFFAFLLCGRLATNRSSSRNGGGAARKPELSRTAEASLLLLFSPPCHSFSSLLCSHPSLLCSLLSPPIHSLFPFPFLLLFLPCLNHRSNDFGIQGEPSNGTCQL